MPDRLIRSDIKAHFLKCNIVSNQIASGPDFLGAADDDDMQNYLMDSNYYTCGETRTFFTDRGKTDLSVFLYEYVELARKHGINCKIYWLI